MQSLLVGFGFGFFVALQFGPMSLFLVRSTLVGGWTVGLAIGAGIALIDALYALAGAAGAAPLLAIDALRTVLGLLGAVVLLALGVRALRAAVRPPADGTVRSEVATPRRAFLVSLAAPRPTRRRSPRGRRCSPRPASSARRARFRCSSPASGSAASPG